MAMEILVGSLNELDEAARLIIENHKSSRIFAFFGEMGAGKTTLIKAICKYLKVKQTVNSPTFSIVNEYDTEQGKRIFHFDFYRIKKIEEVYDIGYEEYFYSDNYCFIEWPEKIESLLPEEHIAVKIVLEGNNRKILLP